MGTIKEMTVEQALILFEQNCIKRGDALYEGNSKLANRCYDKIRSLASFLRKESKLSQLAAFYTHPNLNVRLTAAAYMLPVDEKQSLKVLKEIAQKKVFGSLDAQMTIREWKNGNLKNFYTL